MDFQCIMELRSILFVIFIFFSDAVSAIKCLAYFSETADLPCHFINPQNISLDELVVFWQDQHNRVLYELYKGKEKPENVHPMYKGRTSLDQDNWTLRLHNVQIKDRGSYQCYVHRQGPNGLVSIHQKIDNYLLVLANFSQPEISLISNRTENSDNINFTCASTKGYPEPKKMSFVLKTENSTNEYDALMNIFQDNITELYNVSGSLSLPVSPEANVSIFCVLQPTLTQTWLRSQPYNIDAKSRNTRQLFTDHGILITTLPVLFIVCVTVVSLIVKKRKKKQPGPSHECEAIEMEGEENEQAKQRVENRVPERSDETQCVDNISKTASENKTSDFCPGEGS
ncbi:T-lymphocyte activation antigen CD86 isoform X4 [Rhinolophus ferrumequinum]|uniref:T-lymphocyte activation antigen CD86 isoform X4 n=1 Tax=Rhinolophus ferrumequinum TaxID=59479 RepID=UPI00140FA007|nr:T-lymphocyte activation antigen CD86 isoform X4 [Rhinolophus ferrumequinum]